jgi:hypothetical protein
VSRRRRAFDPTNGRQERAPRSLEPRSNTARSARSPTRASETPAWVAKREKVLFGK